MTSVRAIDRSPASTDLPVLLTDEQRRGNAPLPAPLEALRRLHAMFSKGSEGHFIRNARANKSPVAVCLRLLTFG